MFQIKKFKKKFILILTLLKTAQPITFYNFYDWLNQ